MANPSNQYLSSTEMLTSVPCPAQLALEPTLIADARSALQFAR